MPVCTSTVAVAAAPTCTCTFATSLLTFVTGTEVDDDHVDDCDIVDGDDDDEDGAISVRVPQALPVDG